MNDIYVSRLFLIHFTIQKELGEQNIVKIFKIHYYVIYVIVLLLLFSKDQNTIEANKNKFNNCDIFKCS